MLAQLGICCRLSVYMRASDVGGGGGLSSSEIASRIAKGHAFEEHVVRSREFSAITAIEGIDEQKLAFADLIGYVIDTGEQAQISRGRTKYFDEELEIIVIVNPRDFDFGTAYFGDRAAFLRVR